jgi:hypothetical protein
MAIMFNATFNDISAILWRLVSLYNKNLNKYEYSGLGLWWLTPLSTIFPLYRVGQFYLWVKPEYSEKTTNLSQIIDKL